MSENQTGATMKPTTADVERVKALAGKATPGPWCYESVGEKGDGCNIVGVCFGPDDEDCKRPLSGLLPEWTDDGKEIEYYRDELVAVCEHSNRNPGGDAAYIAAASPEVVAQLADESLVLRELVACKALKDRIEAAQDALNRKQPATETDLPMLWREYERRTSLAWQRARDLIGGE